MRTQINIFKKHFFQIYIIGGYDSSGNTVNSMEVFDSQHKTITKVLDNQNKWVQVPIDFMVQEGSATCALPLIDKNAFILSGGRKLQSQGFLYLANVIMFHIDTR